MFIFNEETTKRTLTPWGCEVKKKLIDKNMTQQNLVDALRDKGYRITKQVFSQMLVGLCRTTRSAEIHEINLILEIPEEGDENNDGSNGNQIG